MTVGLRFFYRHIHVTGLENIPAKGPAIIIANHASSLMDAALLGILLKRPAYFFARGDVFVNKPVQLILSWLHMMPVYNHLKGGKNTVGANDDSFALGQKVLSKGGIVVFFPESTSHTERQIMSFRKGVFRLAFQTAEQINFTPEIPIVPIGLTYEHPFAGRTVVLVHAGKPLFLSAYKKIYTENKAATLLRISKDAYQSMRGVALHVENADRLVTTEYCLIISRNNFDTAQSSWKIKSGKRLQHEQSVCEYINELPENEYNLVEDETKQYFDELKKYQLTDKTIAGSGPIPKWKRLILKVAYSIYLVGMFFNGLPVYIARQLADKKVYRKDFYSWIFVSCYSVLYFLWVVMLLLISAYLGWPYLVILFVLIVPAGLFAYHYTGWLKSAGQHKKLLSLPEEIVSRLQTWRNQIAGKL
jgi:1-acyl-sn-glycerol-3-phosphate acyltransferase